MEFKEVFDDLSYITERKSGKTIISFAGPFQEMNDIRNNKNRNGRRYTKELWELSLGSDDVKTRLASGRMLGELDHPKDEGKIRRTSHIIKGINPNYSTGIVDGKLEILNHDQGDSALLKALVAQGVEMCVSSRGRGEFIEDGCTINPKTFNLQTWDVVLDPSVPIAKLNQVAESLNKNFDEENQLGKFLEMDTKDKKTIVPVVTDIETGKYKLKEKQMEEKLIKAIEANAELKVKAAVAESNLENMKNLVSDKNTMIESLNSRIETLTADADKLGEDLTVATKTIDENKVLLEANTKSLDENKATIEESEKSIKESKEANEKTDAVIAENQELSDKAAEVINEQADLADEAAETINTLVDKLEAKKSEEEEEDDNDGEEEDDNDGEDEDDKEKKGKKNESINESLIDTMVGSI